jgi:hypothetical protein
MNRRTFALAAATAGLLSSASPADSAPLDLRHVERARVLRAAYRHLAAEPVTITSLAAPRSPGGPHDYYSEADYWWPDPGNPSGPYVRRDGFSNPAKFTAHRDALIRLSLVVPALAAAFQLTGEARYAAAAERHLSAWFVDEATRMAPHLEFAQAIVGVNTGRGIGVIDTVHLVEVARATSVLQAMRGDGPVYDGLRAWFAAYLDWMMTSAHGKEEQAQPNNHGTAWVLQVAEFARLTARHSASESARARLKALITGQIAPDGRQPLELARTKPFGYSLFNLDVLATSALVLSTPREDLWRFQPAGAGSIAKALAFMAPFVADKRRWSYPPDVEQFNGWPVRQPSLLFGGLALAKPDYLALWRSLDPEPRAAEVIRNYPVRQPLLWLS